MSKKDNYLLLASQLYIERQMSVATISQRLNISQKTLFTWKKEDDWDNKRKRFLKSQYSCNQSLYELLNLIVKKALDDYYAQSIVPDQKTLYFIMNMAGKLKDLKAFEDNQAQEKIEETKEIEPKEENASTTDEMLQKILKAMSE